MDNASVERSVWIAAPPERVWQAITDPAQLDQWYATNYRWELPTLAVGATFKFHNGPAEVLTGVIEVLNPPHEFRLRWEPYGETPALVTAFTLLEENGGTRATITETGYEAVPASERQQWLDATGAGYAMSVENLKAHVEGRSLPF